MMCEWQSIANIMARQIDAVDDICVFAREHDRFDLISSIPFAPLRAGIPAFFVTFVASPVP